MPENNRHRPLSLQIVAVAPSCVVWVATRRLFLVGMLPLIWAAISPQAWAGNDETTVHDPHELPLPSQNDAEGLSSPLTTPADLDDLWLIDSRDPTRENPCPRFHRYNCGDWTAADENGFLEAASDGIPVCVWIHGYQCHAESAIQVGLEVYQQMRRLAPAEVKFRFVIWSWPSLKNGPWRIDAQRKARRSDIEGYKLARVLEKLPAHVPVGLLGFSFGSRLAGSTLHFLGGGSIANLQLQSHSAPGCRPVRAVLLAGAVDNNAFETNGLNSCALSVADCVLVLINRLDPALIGYHHLEKFRGTMAMGHTGPEGISATCVTSWNVTAAVRVSHDWRRYIRNDHIMGPITSLVLFFGSSDACVAPGSATTAMGSR